ncbi:hypothetical protein [Paraburkholderia tuberum]|uniref:hypothetical protein n=1 Tax=Paraburkholderia tuberum TaxID=157910 RepID=UPI001428D04F
MTSIVGEIAQVSREQSDGIQQLGIAITQMVEVTQQNAALVEKSAAAAASPADQARALREVMEGFGVDEAPAPPPRYSEGKIGRRRQARRLVALDTGQHRLRTGGTACVDPRPSCRDGPP